MLEYFSMILMLITKCNYTKKNEKKTFVKVIKFKLQNSTLWAEIRFVGNILDVKHDCLKIFEKF